MNSPTYMRFLIALMSFLLATHNQGNWMAWVWLLNTVLWAGAAVFNSEDRIQKEKR